MKHSTPVLKVPFPNCKVTCLMTCPPLCRPKIHRTLANLSLFWHWVSLFLLSSIKIINATYDKKRKKERRQTFRPHMGALFSAIMFSSIRIVSAAYGGKRKGGEKAGVSAAYGGPLQYSDFYIIFPIRVVAYSTSSFRIATDKISF